MTDDLEYQEPEFETFRADRSSRRAMSERTRLLIVGAVAGFLFTLLAYAWVRAPSPSRAPPQSRPAAGESGRTRFYRGLAHDFAETAR